MRISLAFAVALSAAVVALPLAAARSGDLDPTFGDGGKLVSEAGGGVFGNGLAIQPDGKIVVATVADGYRLLRFLPDGRPDTRFGSGGSAPTAGVRVALAPRGKIVVAGRFEGEGDGNLVVARHTSTGSLDPSFGREGTVTTDLGGNAVVSSLLVESGGKIVAVGGWRPRDASPDDFSAGRVAVVRYLPSGRLDRRFARRGVFLGLPGVDVVGGAPAPGGKLVAAGMRISNGFFAQLVVIRLTARGRLDRTFSHDGIATAKARRPGEPFPHAVAVQPDGKVIVVNAGVEGGAYGVLRFRADGSRDADFGSARSQEYGPPIYNRNAVRIDARGRIIVAGDGPDIGQDFAVMRLTRSGELDERFGNQGTVTTDFGGHEGALALALQRDGRIVVGGLTAQNFPGPFRLAFARYLPSP